MVFERVDVLDGDGERFGDELRLPLGHGREEGPGRCCWEAWGRPAFSTIHRAWHAWGEQIEQG